MTSRDDERRKFEAWCPIKITDVTKAPKAAALKAAYWTAWEACAELARAEQAETPRAAESLCAKCQIPLSSGEGCHMAETPVGYVSVENCPRPSCVLCGAAMTVKLKGGYTQAVAIVQVALNAAVESGKKDDVEAAKGLLRELAAYKCLSCGSTPAPTEPSQSEAPRAAHECGIPLMASNNVGAMWTCPECGIIWQWQAEQTWESIGNFETAAPVEDRPAPTPEDK